MRAALRIWNVAPFVALIGACAVGLSPMINYSTLRTHRQATFFVDGNTIAIQASNPQGGNLALDAEPRLDQGRVVLVAGLTSSGSAGVKTYCRDVGRLSPAPDWPSRVFWRNPNGELIHIRSSDRGEAARELIAKCCGVRKATCEPIHSSAGPPNTVLQADDHLARFAPSVARH